MNEINSGLLNKFIKKAGRELKGEWVLIGGSVLPALGLDVRVTRDIDLVGKSESDGSQVQLLKIMDLAKNLGLPIEAINQAGAFFLHKISGFERRLVILHVGPNATFYRPNVDLYVELKLDRLSESDLQDCLAMIQKLGKNEKVSARLVKKIRSATKNGRPKAIRASQLLSRIV